MPATNATQVTLTWSTDATVTLRDGTAVSAFATKSYAVRGDFEDRLVVCILPPNAAKQNLPNDPTTRNLVQQRLFEVMDYVAPNQLVAVDWRGGIPQTPVDGNGVPR